MTLRALIADDETLARDELAYMLRQVGGVGEIDQAEDAAEALARLQEGQYDVLFLDIRMAGLSGLEAMHIIEKLPRRPPVVFVTAYDEHALAAFEVAAADYLLKPVSAARLKRALERVRTSDTPKQRTRRPLQKLPVEGEDHTVLVRISDVRLVHARGHTVLVRTYDQEYRSRSALTELEELLGPHGFLRVHRAYLVNPDHVLEVHPFFEGAYLLRVDDKHRSEVPVSRASARRMREAFGL